MGLDVRVYKNCKLTSGEIGDFTAEVLIPEWNDRIKNLEIGGEYTGERGCTVNHSYSGYNKFRKKLSLLSRRISGMVTYRIKPETCPFFELIEFADNQGCIDWDTAKDLYKDFVVHEKHAKELSYLAEDLHFFERYQEWKHLTKEASEINSVIVFQ